MFGLAALIQKVRERQQKALAALYREERLANLTEPNQVRKWTGGDGTRIAVSRMSESHLFYALAKARRGEYPDSYSRQTGIEALEVEAFRRLRERIENLFPHMHNYDNR